MNIEIKGLNIKYTDSSPNSQLPVVAVLQGWGTSLEVYQCIEDILSEKYRVIRLDFPGFGESSEPGEAWNVDAFSDFFVDFLEALKIQKATLIGHSYGGRVIIKLAARESLPFEITNIVLIDSAGVVPEKTPAQLRKIKRYKLLKNFYNSSFMTKLFPDLVENWKSRQGSADYRNASPIMRKCLVMAVNEDLCHLFPKVDKEVLLIWGEGDTATSIEDAKKMEALMPNAGLAVIPGTGHYCFLENPMVFRNIMKSYFKMGD